MPKAKRNRKLLVIIPVLLIVAIVGVVGFHRLKPEKANTCVVLQSPVDVSKVTAVLYPGQFRGGQYKPHGGFRLDDLKTNAVDVKAPLDAQLVDAAQYLEQGETQYILDFQTSCGLNYRFDHLRALAPNIQTAIQNLPAPQNEQSQTHKVNPLEVTTGEIVATEVGFKSPTGVNVSFDFGVYDRGIKNAASKDPKWVASLGNEDKWQAEHAVCWLDLLPPDDVSTLKALPGGDMHAGKTSDYCH